MLHVNESVPDYRYAARIDAEPIDQMGIPHVIAVADQMRVGTQDFLRLPKDRLGRGRQIAQRKINEDDIGNGNDFGAGNSGKFGPEDRRAIPDIGELTDVYLAHESQQLLPPDRLIDANRELVAAQLPQRRRRIGSQLPHCGKDLPDSDKCVAEKRTDSANQPHDQHDRQHEQAQKEQPKAVHEERQCGRRTEPGLEEPETQSSVDSAPSGCKSRPSESPLFSTPVCVAQTQYVRNSIGRDQIHRVVRDTEVGQQLPNLGYVPGRTGYRNGLGAGSASIARLRSGIPEGGRSHGR